MKLAIYTREESSKIETICLALRSLSIEYVINPLSVSRDEFNFAVTLGGDGTFLDAVRQMGAGVCGEGGGSYVPLLGINSGRLGFLATISIEECAVAFEALAKGQYSVEERTMLEVLGIEQNEGCNFALNEFAIQKRDVSMVETQIKIDGAEVATYWGDGVIVSTPTGSTAYSMSVGGSILTPQSPCFIISPVATHNLSIRPLVVHDTAIIELIVRSRFDEGAIATVDNSRYEVKDEQHFTLSKSYNKLEIINIGDTNFYNTLRKKLHWAVDLRN